MSFLGNLASMVTKPKPPVGTTPADVIHHENKWRLLHYRPAAGARKFATPVLLVPSLINRHYVMDLLPGKSMAEDLVKSGHDVYCLDWGTPGPEDRHLTFDDICDRYLGRAIRKVAKLSPRGKTHVLGYCLGGTLATVHATVHQEYIASLLLLAAPVSFAGDQGLLEVWTQSSSFQVGDIVDAFGNVPWQLMQAAFTMLRPTLGLSKAVHVVDKAFKDDPVNANKWDEFSEGFRALETWGNDNVSFPGACFVRYIEELYRKDALMAGTFSLSGQPARLEKIHVPTMSIVFEHDNIVPWRNAAVLVEKIASTDKQVLRLPGGHVGAVVSRSAQKSLWPKMSSFWASRDADAPKASVTLNGHANGHANGHSNGHAYVPVRAPEPAPVAAARQAAPPAHPVPARTTPASPPPSEPEAVPVRTTKAGKRRASTRSGSR